MLPYIKNDLSLLSGFWKNWKKEPSNRVRVNRVENEASEAGYSAVEQEDPSETPADKFQNPCRPLQVSISHPDPLSFSKIQGQ